MSFYRVATFAMKVALVSLSRWEVIGEDNVPKNGSLIVVANHLSMVDPPLLSASVPRRIVFMAKEELFHSVGGLVVRAFGAFPVKRGATSKEAIRNAVRVVQGGKVLGMFPEGRRSPGHAMEKAEPGAALIALRTGAPILPVGISGSQNVKGPGMIFRRPRITVNIGKPFRLADYAEQPARLRLEDGTAIIMKNIADLLPQEYRGRFQ